MEGFIFRGGGGGNKVIVPWAWRKFHITVTGCGNVVKVSPQFKGSARIVINGNNNSVLIEDSPWGSWDIKVFPRMGVTCNNSVVSIGHHVTTSNTAQLMVGEDNSYLRIGDNCALSYDVHIRASDSHAMFVGDETVPFNIGSETVIGNHCWIGIGVKIAKNSNIPSNTIVGMGAVVAGRFTEENTVLVGCPAKVIKREISWDYSSPNEHWRRIKQNGVD